MSPIVKKHIETLKELPLIDWLAEIQRHEQHDRFGGEESMLEYVARFKLFYNEDSLVQQDPRECSTVVRCALRDILNPPSELQLAVASCAT